MRVGCGRAHDDGLLRSYWIERRAKYCGLAVQQRHLAHVERRKAARSVAGDDHHKIGQAVPADVKLCGWVAHCLGQKFQIDPAGGDPLEIGAPRLEHISVDHVLRW